MKYAWRPVMCTICKSSGHVAQACRRVTIEWRPKSNDAHSKKPHVPNSDDTQENAAPKGDSSNGDAAHNNVASAAVPNEASAEGPAPNARFKKPIVPDSEDTQKEATPKGESSNEGAAYNNVAFAVGSRSNKVPATSKGS